VVRVHRRHKESIPGKPPSILGLLANWDRLRLVLFLAQSGPLPLPDLSKRLRLNPKALESRIRPLLDQEVLTLTSLSEGVAIQLGQKATVRRLCYRLKITFQMEEGLCLSLIYQRQPVSGKSKRRKRSGGLNAAQ